MTRIARALSAAFVACMVASTAQAQIRAGEPFPDLTLPRLSDGEPASISMFRGRKVLLLVFASW